MAAMKFLHHNRPIKAKPPATETAQPNHQLLYVLLHCKPKVWLSCCWLPPLFTYLHRGVGSCFPLSILHCPGQVSPCHRLGIFLAQELGQVWGRSHAIPLIKLKVLDVLQASSQSPSGAKGGGGETEHHQAAPTPSLMSH
jgi:hypothetical protein